jgi:hypothetical protein
MEFKSKYFTVLSGRHLTVISMKLDKAIVQRRLDLMTAEGVVRSEFIFESFYGC